jgi:hypothetical protein
MNIASALWHAWRDSRFAEHRLRRFRILLSYYRDPRHRQ